MTLSKKYGVIGFLLISVHAFSQTDSLQKYLKVTLYVETYFQKQWPNGIDNSRSDYVYSFNRLNEVNLNLGFVKAQFDNNKTRANFGLMAGTYAQANLANEPAALRNIWEANVGFKLLKNRNTWLDMGVLPSHIGFESAIGKDCWHLTRSLMADNSPYFETGLRVSNTSKNEKWYSALLILNGWQNIYQKSNIQTPAFGHQITYEPTDKTLFNSSSFIGESVRDTVKGTRLFHNFYVKQSLTKKWAMIGAFDIGFQTYQQENYQWHAVVLGAQYQWTAKKKWAFRLEQYKDKNNVIISENYANFNSIGASINMDYYINEQMLLRAEAKYFNVDELKFKTQGQFSACMSLSWGI